MFMPDKSEGVTRKAIKNKWPVKIKMFPKGKIPY